MPTVRKLSLKQRERMYGSSSSLRCGHDWEKNGAIAIIMQRWHEDDLVGKLRRVKDRNSEEFIEGFPPIKFINLPSSR